MIASILFLFIINVVHLVDGHGSAVCPPTRGITCPRKPGICWYKPRCKNNYNYKWFFPSGNKTAIPGAGGRSQIAGAGDKWTAYEPKTPGFVSRTGECEDLKGGTQHHLQGGKYY